jgi:hypothetical protein
MKNCLASRLMPDVSTAETSGQARYQARSTRIMETTRQRPSQIDARSAAFGAAGATVAALGLTLAVLFATAAAGSNRPDRDPGNGGIVVPPPASPSAPVVTPRPSATPDDVPDATPTPRPSTRPTSPTPKPRPATPAPTPAPATPAPTDAGHDAMPIRVALRNATGAQVHVDIVDRPGVVVDAESGRPGDGASVPTDTLVVRNVDARTLRLMWVDFPIDNALALYIDRTDAGYRFVLIQPEPSGDTDAMAFDRELILRFAHEVSANDVEAFLQGGFDTGA